MTRQLVAKVLLATALAVGGACSSGDGAPNEGTGGSASGGTTATGGASGERQAARPPADGRRAGPEASEECRNKPGGIPALEEQGPVGIRRGVRADRCSRGQAVEVPAARAAPAAWAAPPPRAALAARGGAGGMRRRHRQGGAAGMGGGAAGGAGGTVAYAPCPTNGSPCKILPFGDSITEGVKSSDDAGYRSQLFKLIVAAKQKVTFTGSLTNGPTQVSGQTFPRMHEGHAGWTIDPGYSEVHSAMAGSRRWSPAPR